MTDTAIVIPAFEGQLLTRTVGDAPLVAHTVNMATKLSSLVTLVADDEEVAETARRFGVRAEVRERPKWWWTHGEQMVSRLVEEFRPLAGDASGLVFMDPASPFRSLEMMRGLLQELQQRMSVMTVCRFRMEPDELMLDADRPTVLEECLCWKIRNFEWVRARGLFWGVNLAPRPGVDLYNNHFYKVLENPMESIRVTDEASLLAVDRILKTKMYDAGGME